jgi:ABC-2 type transport system ATP-binding protein
MKQKVEIIRILIQNPSILLLDEPFSGLDFNTIKLLVKILIELKEKENLTIVIATHKIEVVQEISDKILILKRGKISKLAPINEIDKNEIESYF